MSKMQMLKTVAATLRAASRAGVDDCEIQAIAQGIASDLSASWDKPESKLYSLLNDLYTGGSK